MAQNRIGSLPACTHLSKGSSLKGLASQAEIAQALRRLWGKTTVQGRLHCAPSDSSRIYLED